MVSHCFRIKSQLIIAKPKVTYNLVSDHLSHLNVILYLAWIWYAHSTSYGFNLCLDYSFPNSFSSFMCEVNFQYNWITHNSSRSLSDYELRSRRPLGYKSSFIFLCILYASGYDFSKPNLTDKNEWVSPNFANKFLIFLFLFKTYFRMIISLLNRINWKNIWNHHN